MKFFLVITILLFINCVSGLDIFNYLYSRSSPQVPILIQDFQDVKINISKPLKVIIHGWLGSTFNTVYSDMKDELLRKEDCNVILLDWSKDNGEIAKSVVNTKLVGKVLGETLYYLYDNYDLIHLIGYGLGAHLAGFAGKIIQSYSEDKTSNMTNQTNLSQDNLNVNASNQNTLNRIGRISGLDPTLPQFNESSPADRLYKTDATMVDVYHCDGYRFSFGDPIGKVDFYPNGGVAPMPSCSDDAHPLSKLFSGPIEEVFCSHAMVRHYFTYSIKRNDTMATKCDSWKDFNDGLCDKNEKVVFGYYVSPESNGSFYLNLTLA